MGRHSSWRKAKPLRHVLRHDGLSRRSMQEHVGQPGLFKRPGIGKLDSEVPRITGKGGRSRLLVSLGYSLKNVVMSRLDSGQRRLTIWGRDKSFVKGHGGKGTGPSTSTSKLFSATEPSPCPPCHHFIEPGSHKRCARVTEECHPIHDGASSSCNGDEKCMVTGSTMQWNL